jgi:ABC-type maltose transport system permease subunit
LQQMWILITSGKLPRPDLLIAVPAWTANLILLLSCAWAYSRLRNKQGSDSLRFAATLAISIGYMAAIMALFQPRYLGLFPRLLHPHFNL